MRSLVPELWISSLVEVAGAIACLSFAGSIDPASAASAPGIVSIGVTAGKLGAAIVGAGHPYGPENERSLARIRARIISCWSDGAELGDAEQSALARADEELSYSLKSCMLGRQQLAQTAIDPRGFPVAATELVVRAMGLRNRMFLIGDPTRNDTAVAFLEKVVNAAFEAAIDDRRYWASLEPHLMFAMAAELGAIKASVAATDTSIHREAASTRLLISQEIDLQTEKLIRAIEVSRGAVSRDALIVALAQRINREVTDWEQAVHELNAAVDLALTISFEAKRPQNTELFARSVLHRVSKLTEAANLQGAVREIDGAILQWEEEERTRRQVSTSTATLLLEAAVRQHMLSRDVKTAAARLLQQLDLEQPLQTEERYMRAELLATKYRTAGQGTKSAISLEVAIAFLRHVVREATAVGQAQWSTIIRDLPRSRPAVSDYAALMTRIWFLRLLLGETLVERGRLDSNSTHLYESLAVLKECRNFNMHIKITESQFPQLNTGIGRACLELAEREDTPLRINQAIKAFRVALAIFERREGDVLSVINAQTDLAVALSMDDDNEARVMESVALARWALANCPSEISPLNLAVVHNSLGTGLSILGRRRKHGPWLEEAIKNYQSGEALTNRDIELVAWLSVRINWASALIELGEINGKLAQLVEAIEILEGISADYEVDLYPTALGKLQYVRGRGYEALAELTGATQHWVHAEASLANAVNTFSEMRPRLHRIAWKKLLGVREKRQMRLLQSQTSNEGSGSEQT
ncbi:MAG: hypothetical protein ABMA14_08300 [Hyphomonadaceae bacterium]